MAAAEPASDSTRTRGRSTGAGSRGAREPSRGQATVELVLLMPLVVVVLLAVLQIALLGAARVSVVHAAREGAREAAVTSDDTRVRSVVASSVAGGGGDIDVAVVGERREGGYVTVSVTNGLRPSVPVVSAFFPRVVHVRAAVTMRIEEP